MGNCFGGQDSDQQSNCNTQYYKMQIKAQRKLRSHCRKTKTEKQLQECLKKKQNFQKEQQERQEKRLLIKQQQAKQFSSRSCHSLQSHRSDQSDKPNINSKPNQLTKTNQSTQKEENQIVIMLQPKSLNSQDKNIKCYKQKVPKRQPYFINLHTLDNPKPVNMLQVAKIRQKLNYGISNIGNTCYLNSALQCLYQTQQLHQQLNKQDGIFSDYIDKQFTNQYKQMCVYLQVKKTSFKPFKIKDKIQKYNSRFKGNRQHDSGEVLNTILNIIDHETNTRKNAKAQKIEYKYQESDKNLYRKYEKKHHGLSYSLIDYLFTGWYKTVYRCCECNQQKRLFQKFTMVYLPLTKKNQYLTRLQECIKQFYQQQPLDWDCLTCKETPHKKTMCIYKPNKILIFCLKRFNQDNTKIKNPIDIPLYLNLSEFGQSTYQLNKQNYVLYAAIIHKGQFYSGHYIALCIDYRTGCWAEFDDSSVRRINLEYVKSQIKKAYILFYRLQKFNKQQEELIEISE